MKTAENLAISVEFPASVQSESFLSRSYRSENLSFSRPSPINTNLRKQLIRRESLDPYFDALNERGSLKTQILSTFEQSVTIDLPIADTKIEIELTTDDLEISDSSSESESFDEILKNESDIELLVNAIDEAPESATLYPSTIDSYFIPLADDSTANSKVTKVNPNLRISSIQSIDSEKQKKGLLNRIISHTKKSFESLKDRGQKNESQQKSSTFGSTVTSATTSSWSDQESEKDKSAKSYLGSGSTPKTEKLDGKSFAVQYLKVKTHNKEEKELSRLIMVQELASLTQSLMTLTNQTNSPEVSGTIWVMRFSSDGQYLAVGGIDTVLRVWGLFGAPKPDEIPRPESPMGSPKRRSFDNLRAGATKISIQTSPIFAKLPVRCYQGHQAAILDVSWSSNNFLISASLDKTVRLWHVSREECLCVFQHTDSVTSVRFHPFDDRFFVSGSMDRRIRIWSLKDKNVHFWNELPTDSFTTAVSFSQDGRVVIVGTYHGDLVFYEFDGLKYNTQVQVTATRGKKSGPKITGIENMPEESSTYQTFRQKSPSKDPKPNISSVEKLLVTSNDSKIRIYNLRDKSLYRKFRGHENKESQNRASISKDGRYIFCGSEDKCAYMWNLKSLNSAKFTFNQKPQHVPLSNSSAPGSASNPQEELLSGIKHWRNVHMDNRASTFEKFLISDDHITTVICAPPVVREYLEKCKLRDSDACFRSADGLILVSSDLSGRIRVFENVAVASTSNTRILPIETKPIELIVAPRAEISYKADITPMINISHDIPSESKIFISHNRNSSSVLVSKLGIVKPIETISTSQSRSKPSNLKEDSKLPNISNERSLIISSHSMLNLNFTLFMDKEKDPKFDTRTDDLPIKLGSTNTKLTRSITSFPSKFSDGVSSLGGQLVPLDSGRKFDSQPTSNINFSKAIPPKKSNETNIMTLKTTKSSYKSHPVYLLNLRGETYFPPRIALAGSVTTIRLMDEDRQKQLEIRQQKEIDIKLNEQLKRKEEEKTPLKDQTLKASSIHFRSNTVPLAESNEINIESNISLHPSTSKRNSIVAGSTEKRRVVSMTPNVGLGLERSRGLLSRINLPFTKHDTIAAPITKDIQLHVSPTSPDLNHKLEKDKIPRARSSSIGIVFANATQMLSETNSKACANEENSGPVTKKEISKSDSDGRGKNSLENGNDDETDEDISCPKCGGYELKYIGKSKRKKNNTKLQCTPCSNVIEV
ncbi:hypothetical protein HK096_002225 [Nowakowskiella sp. JEL0078]|nr:hypothetical protein HK096_002225 [Nowakowskiella sp. JEL0078]